MFIFTAFLCKRLSISIRYSRACCHSFSSYPLLLQLKCANGISDDTNELGEPDCDRQCQWCSPDTGKCVNMASGTSCTSGGSTSKCYGGVCQVCCCWACCTARQWRRLHKGRRYHVQHCLSCTITSNHPLFCSPFAAHRGWDVAHQPPPATVRLTA